MKIKHPDWYDFEGDNQKICPAKLAKWFEKYIDPINKMLDLGIQVSRVKDTCVYHELEHPANVYDYKGMVINMQLIKEETIEDVLMEILYWEDNRMPDDLRRRAEKVLSDDRS